MLIRRTHFSLEVLLPMIVKLSCQGICDPTETQIYSELRPCFRNLSVPLLNVNTIARSITCSLENHEEDFLKWKKNGVLVKHEAGNWITLPFLMLEWASQKREEGRLGNNQLALFHHIQNVFHHDAMCGLNREKHAEHVMIHVEAAIRLAGFMLESRTWFLSTLFKGAENSN